MNKSTNPIEGRPLLDDPKCKINSQQYEVVHCWPHHNKAFTEGLEFCNGFLYESTGGTGDHQSTLRRVEVKTGKVLDLILVNKDYFAEGLAIFNGKLFQLTEDSGVGLIYDLKDLSHVPHEFKYNGWERGWGLTHDGKNLILSDGTEKLYFVDPNSLTVVGKPISVHYENGTLQDGLNELEYIKGSIYANVYPTPYIVRISPQTGTVLDQIDLSALRPPETELCITCVHNGIAYDEESDHLLVTGKMWPTLFEIRLIGKSSTSYERFG